MVARVRTVAFRGVEVVEVETQVTITAGLPAFPVVGLPDKAVAESRERVRAALGALFAALAAAERESRLICRASRGGEPAGASEVEVIAPRILLVRVNHF